MRFRPCIDLHNGKVKQIVGGSLSDSGAIENFVSEKSASYFAELYKNDGLTGGHIIMLGPGNEEQAITALKAFPGGMQIGGGINPQNAQSYINAGASHVIITSYMFSSGKMDYGKIKKINEVIEKDKIVFDLSCRRKDGLYYVVTDRWTNFTDFIITRENLAKLEKYCDEFLVHAVDFEGLRTGIDKELVSLLSQAASIPVTYAGGVKDFSDVRRVFKIGKSRIDLTIGSALDIFGGNIPYKKLIKMKEFR